MMTEHNCFDMGLIIFIASPFSERKNVRQIKAMEDSPKGGFFAPYSYKEISPFSSGISSSS